MSEKVWFITGTSRGFGRQWTIAALERGDKVAATARDAATLDDLVDKHGDALLPIRLDVTDRAADFAAVKQAHEHFGRLDVVVNNAGYAEFGFIEELCHCNWPRRNTRAGCVIGSSGSRSPNWLRDKAAYADRRQESRIRAAGDMTAS